MLVPHLVLLLDSTLKNHLVLLVEPELANVITLLMPLDVSHQDSIYLDQPVSQSLLELNPLLSQLQKPVLKELTQVMFIYLLTKLVFNVELELLDVCLLTQPLLLKIVYQDIN
jgi:hypothetical protein